MELVIDIKGRWEPPLWVALTSLHGQVKKRQASLSTKSLDIFLCDRYLAFPCHYHDLMSIPAPEIIS